MSNFVFYGELSRVSNDEILFRFLNLNKEGSRTFDKVSRNKRLSRCCRVVGSESPNFRDIDISDSVAVSDPPCGEGTPYDGLYGEAPPEKGIFFRLQIYERVGISLVKV